MRLLHFSVFAFPLLGCSQDYNIGSRHLPPDVEILAPEPGYPYLAGREILALGRVELNGDSSGRYRWRLVSNQQAGECDEDELELAQESFSGVAVAEVRFSASPCDWSLELKAWREELDIATSVPLVVVEDEAPWVDIQAPANNSIRQVGEPTYILAEVADDHTAVQDLSAEVIVNGESVATTTPDSLGQVFWLLEASTGTGEVEVAIEVSDGSGNTGDDSVMFTMGSASYDTGLGDDTGLTSRARGGGQ